MHMKLSKLIIIAIFALVSCGPGRLTRTDLSNLPDKNFYLTEVSVDHSSNRDFYVKGLSVELETFKKSVQAALPVDGITKAISDDLKITVDSSEFKKAVLTDTKPKWKSDKKDLNRIKIKYTLIEAKATGGFAAIGLRLSCLVEIIAADGKTISITVNSPENVKQCFTPERIAEAKKVPVVEVVKVIIAEEFKTLPGRVAQELKYTKK